MTTRYYTNDVDRPTSLLREDEGVTAYYRDGAWIESQMVWGRISNGGDADEVSASQAETIRLTLNRRDGIAEKAHNDRASPPIIEEDREATEAAATSAVQSALDKLQKQLQAEMSPRAGSG